MDLSATWEGFGTTKGGHSGCTDMIRGGLADQTMFFGWGGGVMPALSRIWLGERKRGAERRLREKQRRGCLCKISRPTVFCIGVSSILYHGGATRK
jgi:hypothetical protein